jgi:predicted TIM-barrel fold metal-dependent hydrolase
MTDNRLDRIPQNPTYELPAIGKPPEPPMLRKIALEEHFNVVSAQKDAAGVDLEAIVRTMDYNRTWLDIVGRRLVEFDEKRLAGMDASGIDIAILSMTVPGVQGILDRGEAVSRAREINDFLAARVARHPDRFAGFASVALQDPAEAAKELERCMTQLGFKGVMINGFTNTAAPSGGQYLDNTDLNPFWEAAAALQAPVYLHPRPPLDQRSYEGHPELIGAAWGFAPETATHALRLVYSGLFDRLPELTLVLGHLGETLPFFAWRIQHCFEYNPSDKRVQKRLQDYLCENFYLTTSGNFNDQALICAVLTVGADRILFSTDYPYEMMEPAARWIERAPISENDRRKIARGNARALFRI